MTEIVGIDKKIVFKTDDDKITNIFIVAMENFGMTSYQIKFSIKVNADHDAWYLINSINPLKVFSGNAGTFVQSQEWVVCNEFEIINFVISKTPDDFYEMANGAKLVKAISDFY